MHVHDGPARPHLQGRPRLGHRGRARRLRLRRGRLHRAGERDRRRTAASEPPARAGGWRWLASCWIPCLARFGTGTGGFYDTADDSERLIYRPADVADGPSPSGTFAVADALLSYSALTGSASITATPPIGALASVPALAARFPRAAGSGLAVAEAVLSGPVEIAIVGPAGAERTELHGVAVPAAPPGAVIAVGDGALQPRATARADSAAGRPDAGRRPAGRVRLPELQLPRAGHRAGPVARDALN